TYSMWIGNFRYLRQIKCQEKQRIAKVFVLKGGQFTDNKTLILLRKSSLYCWKSPALWGNN
ncbi:hypothetical protein, partial [Escherichia coli]|uniref:hypothetical protein n=1 Tax=Escherichia coli TaxID=562 RepID=UPI00289F7198